MDRNVHILTFAAGKRKPPFYFKNCSTYDGYMNHHPFSQLIMCYSTTAQNTAEKATGLRVVQEDKKHPSRAEMCDECAEDERQMTFCVHKGVTMHVCTVALCV